MSKPKERYFKALVEFAEPYGKCILVVSQANMHRESSKGKLFAELIGSHVGKEKLIEITKLECARLALEGWPVWKRDKRCRLEYRKLG